VTTLFPSVVQRRADPTYALGRSKDEYDRLMAQSAVLAPLSRRLLTAAGLSPGMFVLDVGCGVGDLSMLAAELVGPTGQVLGVDLDSDALHIARARAESAGLTQIEFVTGDLRDLSDVLEVDAVIGRLVLMYLEDPADGLRLVSRLVRPGGVVAFQEINLSSAPVSAPLLESWHRMVCAIYGAFEAAKCHTDMAQRLPSAFQAAGIEPAGVLGDFLVGMGDDAMFEWAAATYRRLYPLAVGAGMVDPADAGPEALIERVRATLASREHVVWSPSFVGVHARRGP
jgi:ubiquinone/menaquinone biosynthesis C-methylase UbiE